MPERKYFFFWVTFWPLNFHENLSFEIEANLWRVLFQILFILLYKKNIEVHENSSNSSNTALINILMVLWCSPELYTHFWYITSKMRFFFFLTIRNVGADLKWGVFQKRGSIFRKNGGQKSKNCSRICRNQKKCQKVV